MIQGLLNLKDSLTGGLNFRFINTFDGWLEAIIDHRRIGICDSSNRMYYLDTDNQIVIMRKTGSIVTRISIGRLRGRVGNSSEFLLIRPEALQHTTVRERVIRTIADARDGVKVLVDTEGQEIVQRLFTSTPEFKEELL